MKKVMLLACAAAAALMTGQESAEAQFGFGGYRGGGWGYSQPVPRSSFSIGFTSSRGVGGFYNTGWGVPQTRRHWGYQPQPIYRHRHIYSPRVYRRGGRCW